MLKNKIPYPLYDNSSFSGPGVPITRTGPSYHFTAFFFFFFKNKSIAPSNKINRAVLSDSDLTPQLVIIIN